MQLTREQLDQLTATFATHLGYLHWLCERMDRLGWSPLEKMRLQVEAADNAMHTLTVEVRYRDADAAKRERR